MSDTPNTSSPAALAALAARVHGNSAPSPDQMLDHAEQVAIDTLEQIRDALVALRQQRDELNGDIKMLVDAEALWQPIVNRILRNREVDDPDDSLPLDDRDNPSAS